MHLWLKLSKAIQSSNSLLIIKAFAEIIIIELQRKNEKFDLDKHKGPLHRAADKLLEHLVKNKPELLCGGISDEVLNELITISPEFNKKGLKQVSKEVVKRYPQFKVFVA